MTKNSLESNEAEGKREEPRTGLTRSDELIAESNLLAMHGQVTGFRSLQALAELRMLDAFDALELESYAPTASPPTGDLVALALTLDALEALRRGAS